MQICFHYSLDPKKVEYIFCPMLNGIRKSTVSFNGFQASTAFTCEGSGSETKTSKIHLEYVEADVTIIFWLFMNMKLNVALHKRERIITNS
jgi:hypothetical protein